jgi:hypothetical protein
VRDLDLASAHVWLRCRLRKVFCRACGRVAVEEQNMVEPWQRNPRKRGSVASPPAMCRRQRFSSPLLNFSSNLRAP